MAYKTRKEPMLLKLLRILNVRANLKENERSYYINQEKGYEGEVKFDLLTEKLQSDCLILNDLLLEVFNTLSQIDTSVIFQDTIYLIDVKYHEGEYVYEAGKFKTIGGKIIKNPVDQLKRCESLFLQLLQSLGINLKVEAYVVFVNPEFSLFNAPKHLPLILPTQLNKFLKMLDGKTSKLSDYHKQLADKLVSLHQTSSPYTKVPPYELGQLKLGLTCFRCHSFSVTVDGRKVVCKDCGCKEMVADAVMRCVEEIMLLFPEKRVTTNLVFEWCGAIESKIRIRRILSKNLRMIGTHQWAYFKRKDDE